jgi:GNAT superfamily N-acetyltransferase
MLEVRLERGEYSDYLRLRRFHYRRGRPGVVARVIRAVVRLRSGREELAGVLVLSYPVPCCAERHRVFSTGRRGLRENIAFANAHLRSISRVIVHPCYRGLGLATRLVREAMAECPTPFIEARAQMGRAMPLFERAGMRAVEPLQTGRPVYYWAESGRAGVAVTRL